MALFGCAPKRPLDYSGRAGLIWAMNGGRLVELPSCVQNSSQVMTVTHARDDRGPRLPPRRKRDHSHRRAQPMLSSCVGKPTEYIRMEGRPREGADVRSEHRWNPAVSSMQSITNG